MAARRPAPLRRARSHASRRGAPSRASAARARPSRRAMRGRAPAGGSCRAASTARHTASRRAAPAAPPRARPPGRPAASCASAAAAGQGSSGSARAASGPARPRQYANAVSVKVRFAPSPTGYLHVGGARTALFNWLFARHEGGEFRLRIENTDTSREVAEAVEQIQGTLAWLGLDWDGDVAFQMDRMAEAQEVARRLVEEGRAYEDEGAIRFRMPDEGVTAWDDLVLGRIEYPSEKVEGVVVLRSDGRPTYNFASPIEDRLDGITHVIRGHDHVPNTPKQIR